MPSVRTIVFSGLVLLALGAGAPPSVRLPEPPPEPLRYEPVAVDGGTVLADDPAGTGRVVQALGDVDDADHIAVVVPGTGQNRDNFRTNGSADDSAVPLANGRALYREARLRDPDAKVAVVVWLGYQPPQMFDPRAAVNGQAAVGADELARFRTRLPADAHVTLVCHSYGTVVCGRAATRPGVADDVVALASPGMGVDRAADIRADVWATRTEDDWIRLVPGVRAGSMGHGADPMAPEFGARTFDPGTINGHSSYYTPGSDALATTARVVLGA
ncbi:alpha/beta hydrolase family protein [Murinocardiopsis flavida]|uniref:Alpha/beta hydrolase family protein n=1 Tax=Murinocardiopsis flavida TaxID=645275 RepID=A0A2P8DJL2_9ACTN|nr:alpha/beta hydrolase [Murinocardiopsis flavida]PSK97378.1 alpha/beta hydrolase family protein [Murinocardiopsis flavida]